MSDIDQVIRSQLGVLAEHEAPSPGLQEPDQVWHTVKNNPSHLPGRPGSRWTLTTAAAAFILVVAGVSVVVLSRRSVTVEVPATPSPTGSTEPGTHQPPQPGATPPRWSSGICRESASAVHTQTANFPWVEMPGGLTLRQAGMSCGVLDEETIFDEWTSDDGAATSPAKHPSRRVRLSRTEIRNHAPLATPSTSPAETIKINGKSAKFLNPPPPGYVGVIQLDWEQDANGTGIVVTEGFTSEDTIKIAESFDRGVAEHGPRNPTTALSRDDAVTKFQRMTSTLPRPKRVESKHTTWSAVSQRAALTTNKPGGVEPTAPVWAVAAAGDVSGATGYGRPGDRWGLVVLDADNGDILAITTGGSTDNTDWPPFFSSIIDETPGG